MKRTTQRYLLRGAFVHSSCDRKMESHRAHDEAYYHCRFPEQYTLANRIEHSCNVCLRERDILGPLDHRLAKIFAPHRIDDTIDLLTIIGGLAPTAERVLSTEHAKKTIKQCDAKLTTHRAALEAGADPVLVTGWIAETQATSARAELRTAQSARRAQPTGDDIASLVRANSDLVTVLTRTELAERADL